MLGSVAAAYRSAYAGLPPGIWGLALVSLINRSGTMVLTFLFLYLTQELEVGATTAGRVVALYGVGAILGAQLGGFLTDRFGSRAVQIGSLVATAATFLVIEHLRDLTSVSVAILVLSTANESFRPANSTAIAEHSPAGLRPRAYGVNRMAINLGMTVGPALGGLLAVRDYAWLFRVDAATCLGAALALALVTSKPEAREERADEAPAESPWRDAPFLAAMFLSCLAGLVFFQLFGTFSLYLKEVNGFREDTIGFLFAVNTILIVLFEMVLVARIERRAPLRIAGLGAATLGLGFGLLSLGSSLAWVAFSVAVWTVGEMLWSPMITTFVSLRGGARSRGRYMGLFALSFGVSGVAAPLLGSALYVHASPRILWWTMGVIGVGVGIGFVSIGRWVEGKERAEAA